MSFWLLQLCLNHGEGSRIATTLPLSALLQLHGHPLEVLAPRQMSIHQLLAGGVDAADLAFERHLGDVRHALSQLLQHLGHLLHVLVHVLGHVTRFGRHFTRVWGDGIPSASFANVLQVGLTLKGVGGLLWSRGNKKTECSIMTCGDNTSICLLAVCVSAHANVKNKHHNTQSHHPNLDVCQVVAGTGGTYSTHTAHENCSLSALNGDERRAVAVNHPGGLRGRCLRVWVCPASWHRGGQGGAVILSPHMGLSCLHKPWGVCICPFMLKCSTTVDGSVDARRLTTNNGHRLPYGQHALPQC